DISTAIGVTGTVDANTQGAYTLTYNVSDSSGNAAATVVRTANVVDTGVPSIALIGDNPVLHELQTPYTDAGATASDAADGDLSASITVTGSVDPDI
ncbi:immunoglobulin-like domain-containing protein, partial [Oleiphilus sp. HI0043]|uniref:immunoglobulin-like domain-containing protein n=15 Tax=unclassified Oleiphilus TaxID=2631174 RepID=UPI000A592825